MILSRIILFPYWMTLCVRHLLYNIGALRSRRFDTPVISVGNVTVGGTGKTPMVENIVRTISASDQSGTAVLSRGYKGSNREFHLVQESDSALLVGDEPLQIKRKFPGITVAVDRDRTRGIKSLMDLPAPPKVIILDDGFQRRDIIPSKNIVLIDYTRPAYSDELLPLGRLRDLPRAVRRADAVIFTKCPGWLSEEQRKKMRRRSHLKKKQLAFFSGINFGAPKEVFEGEGDTRFSFAREAIVITGVANPRPLFDYLTKRCTIVGKWVLPDHHAFTRGDIAEINRFAAKNPYAVILTTEKDAQRFAACKGLDKGVRERLYSIPVTMEFLSDEEKTNFTNYLKS